MKLSREELSMLDGTEGPTRQKAMQLLVKYAEALGAEKFITTNNVTVLAGLIEFPEIVEEQVPDLDADRIASLFFLDSDEVLPRTRVRAFTTNHIFTVNREYWRTVQKRPATLRRLADIIEDYCRDIGILNLATCTPYLAGNIPLKGEHCAWTESSAIPFANAVMGARTNIEGCQTSFASALTGRTPYWGLHLDENRLGALAVDVAVQPNSIMDWGLLGYYVGRVAGLNIPVYKNIMQPPSLSATMAFNAAGGSAGGIVMYHIVGVTPEAPTLEAATGGHSPAMSIVYGPRERREAYERLNHSSSDAVDIVVLGCPHYSLERISAVAQLLEGKVVSDNTQLYIMTCRESKVVADLMGFTSVISRAGGILLEDTCGLEFAHESSRVIATDSPKQAHYMPGVLGVQNFFYGTTEDCIDAATSGQWKGGLK
jgi:predicted aconitase